MTSTRATAEFHYDPFSQAAMNDPLSLYHELRDSHPVYYMPQYDTFAISRFEDVYQVLGDTSDTFQTTEGSTPSPDRLRVHFDAGMPLPPTDPIGLHTAQPSTVHGPIRQAHGRPLRPQPVLRLAGDIRGLIDARLDDLLPGGEFDLVPLRDRALHIADQRLDVGSARVSVIDDEIRVFLGHRRVAYSKPLQTRRLDQPRRVIARGIGEH